MSVTSRIYWSSCDPYEGPAGATQYPTSSILVVEQDICIGIFQLPFECLYCRSELY